VAALPREPEAFGEQVLVILGRFFPENVAELSGALILRVDGREFDLSNLYKIVQSVPENGVELVQDYLERILEGARISDLALPFSVAKSKIMPRIQPRSIFNRLDEQRIAHLPFVNDTVLFYVIDLPRTTVSISVEQIMRWGLSIEDIDIIARKNLDTYAPELEVKLVESNDGGRAAVISVRDGYDAARLLLGTLHQRLAPALNGDFLVATPCRDAFLAISDGPSNFVNRFLKRVKSDYRRMPYPITDSFFLVTLDGIAGTRTAA
jgi:uncharacterized protein YtpQ (UPF0354 family)